MTYEDKINELEKINEQLSNPETNLDKSIELFEKSLTLAKECFDKLKEAEGKVTVLKKELSKFVEENFDETQE